MADGFFAAGCRLALVTGSKEDSELRREFNDTNRVIILERDVSDSASVGDIHEATMEAFGRLIF